jgi:hypothetical protein
MSAALRVADVLRPCWKTYNRTHRLPPHVGKAVRSILKCRTSELGGHIHQCDHCKSEVPIYNGCQTRHCPSCQSGAKEKWLDKRREELLPVQYFHVVFTLPHSLNELINANRKVLLSELFSVVGWVLQRFAQDPQWRLEGEIGYVALLHTWTQKLQQHFHIHCIVPGGVWRAETQEWIPCRGNWLFKKESLCDAFRNRFIKRLRSLRKRNKLAYGGPAAALADDQAWEALLAQLEAATWIVFPKATPDDPTQAFEYIASYTHKVAISDHRIKKIDNGKVTYTWRDRSDNNIEKPDTIAIEEFTKRFLMHILPDRFHKIRYGGWLSAAKRKKALPAIREAIVEELPEAKNEETLQERILRKTGVDITLCPNCKQGHLFKTEMRILPCKARSP